MKKIIIFLTILVTIIGSSPFAFNFILERKHDYFINYLELDCSGNRKKALENIADWKKLPLTENIQLLMYGGEREGHFYRYNLAEEANIPEIKNGYYYFYDRYANIEDREDDTHVFRSSFNFSLAFYDMDTDKLYLLEEDKYS